MLHLDWKPDGDATVLALSNVVTLITGMAFAGIFGNYACGTIGFLCQHASHTCPMRVPFPLTKLSPGERTAPGMVWEVLHGLLWGHIQRPAVVPRPAEPTASQRLWFQVWSMLACKSDVNKIQGSLLGTAGLLPVSGGVGPECQSPDSQSGTVTHTPKNYKQYKLNSSVKNYRCEWWKVAGRVTWTILFPTLFSRTSSALETVIVKIQSPSFFCS